MSDVIPYPQCVRTRQRLRRYYQHLQAMRQQRLVELSAEERLLILRLRTCSPDDRAFVHRTVAALQAISPEHSLKKQ